MALLLLWARLLLCVVFFLAGLAKLVDVSNSRKALQNFGVPKLLANWFGILLPLAEIAVAVTLVSTVSAWWGALGGLLLLLCFVAAIVYNLARGRQPECHCFGQLHLAPAGWPTLIRNFVLASVASLIVLFGRAMPGPGFLDWLEALTIAQRIEMLVGVLLLMLLMGEGWVLVQLMAQQGRLLLRLEALETQHAQEALAPTPQPPARMPGLSVGMQAPTFALSNVQGEQITLEALLAWNKPVLLLFSDPGCGQCKSLFLEIEHWQRDYASTLTLVVISQGTLEAKQNEADKDHLTQVLLQQDREVAQSYRAYGTPSAVLVHPDGAVGSPLVQGADAIRNLIARIIGLRPALSAAASKDR
jgi:peroxiredoxin/uncharacterized membrane protein YphA (DoxX/SURF4 family)